MAKAKIGLSSSEGDMLAILDRLAYEDAEAGGSGWADLRVVTEEFFAGEAWTRQVLALLAARGFAEKRINPEDRRLVDWALTEAGADLLAGIQTVADRRPESDEPKDPNDQP